MLQSDNSSGVRPALKKAGVIAVLVVCLGVGAEKGLRHLTRFYTDGAGVAASLGEWNLPGAGESVLPAKVRTMIALLRENHVSEFRYSDAIARDPDESVPQRLAEGAYPIRQAAQARHVLLAPPDVLPANCRAVAARQEVVLADCG